MRKKTTDSATMDDKLTSMRKDYAAGELSERSLPPYPLDLMKLWLQGAISAQAPEPNAMTIASVGKDNGPDARVVLLRGFSDRGLLFYTNYESKKGADVTAHPHVCALFFWPTLERQVRAYGRIEKISTADSDTYFQTRPRESQIGAWASPQSRPIASRSELESFFEKKKNEFAAMEEIPLPPFWGGFHIIPQRFEFWQGRKSRLHDRIIYTQKGSDWDISRLAP